MRLAGLGALLAQQGAVAAQVVYPVYRQCNDFASNVSITPQQAAHAGFDNITASNVAVALNFDYSNWAHGSVLTDPFYTVPANSSSLPAGSLIKVEVDASTYLYTLPPNTALSRIMFQSKTLNDSVVPASAYVLWPYLPRQQADGYAVVAWAHGNSGSYAQCAPSHHRNLWYQFQAPFTLAEEGYVVVAPDYQGLGVSFDAAGKLIRHPLLASPATANDLLYAVQAAQTAFAELSSQFVVMGHSQGGGTAWAAAEKQAVEPMSGYLGTIAASPVTDYIRQLEMTGSVADAVVVPFTPSLLGTFPAFRLEDVLTPAGANLSVFLQDVQGCTSVEAELLTLPNLVQRNWSSSYYVQAYRNLTLVGDKPVARPMLVLQGEADPQVSFELTSEAVEDVCRRAATTLRYVTFANVTHVPVLYAAKRIWLEWIRDRFEGKSVPDGCTEQHYESARPYQYYQSETNWYLEWAEDGYELA